MEPNPNFIPRTIENIPLAKLLERFGNSIADCVNFGSNLMEWIANSKTLDSHDAVMVANLRHFIEQIDAVSELMKKSISEPCFILLRAALESFIIGSYLLQSDHEQRGKSFYYFQFLDQLKLLDKLDSATDVGKQMSAILGKDDNLSNLVLSPPPDAVTVRAGIMTRINSPSYAGIHAEYSRMKTANPRAKIQWHSLFGGPTSIETLANVTGNSGLYEIFYRHSSGFVHGTKILSKSLDHEGISQIRMPFNAQFISSFTLSMCLILFRKYLDHYCKNKSQDYSNWYLSIRGDYLHYSSGELINIS